MRDLLLAWAAALVVGLASVPAGATPTFWEDFHRLGSQFVATGHDVYLPERVDLDYSHRISDPNAGVVDFKHQGWIETKATGPSLEISHKGWALAPDATEWTSSDITFGEAWIHYSVDVVQIRPFPLLPPLTLPFKASAAGAVGVTVSGPGEGAASAYLRLRWDDANSASGFEVRSYYARAETGNTRYSPDITAPPWSTIKEPNEDLAALFPGPGGKGTFTLPLPVPTGVASRTTVLVAMMLSTWVRPDVAGDYPRSDNTGEVRVYANLDPVFSIDPSWEFADYFELTVSPGVTQAVVPEPGTPALLGLALLALAAHRRSRRR